MLLLANTVVDILRTVGDAEQRGGLVDPWDKEDEAAELTVVATGVPCCLTTPAVDGVRQGGTRQSVEWLATFSADVEPRAGDQIREIDGARSWHVDSAVSRVGPPGGSLDYIRASVVSVRGLVDGRAI